MSNIYNRKGPVSLEDDIKMLINEYPLVCTSRPGCYMVRNTDGSKVFAMLAGGCHGGLRQQESYAHDKYYAARYGTLPVGESDHIITAFPAYHVSEFRWYAYMVNHMYKDYAKSFELIDTGIEIADGFTRPGTFVDPYKCAEGEKRATFHIIKVDVKGLPANVLFNFLICSRAVIEKNVNLRLWQRLMDIGVHPSIAIHYIMMMYNNGTTLVQGGAYNHALKTMADEELLDYENQGWVAVVHSHWPFDNTVNVQNTIDGKLASKTRPFPNGGDLTPTNVIWGANGATDSTIFRSKKLRDVAKHYKLPISPVDFTAPLWALDVRLLTNEERTINDEDDARDFD